MTSLCDVTSAERGAPAAAAPGALTGVILCGRAWQPRAPSGPGSHSNLGPSYEMQVGTVGEGGSAGSHPRAAAADGAEK